jgi:hypothetical protein
MKRENVRTLAVLMVQIIHKDLVILQSTGYALLYELFLPERKFLVGVPQ